MEFDTASIVVSLVVGTVGSGIALYGKKQQRIPHLAVGILMIAYPYFVPGALLMAIIGVVLVALLVLAVKRGW